MSCVRVAAVVLIGLLFALGVQAQTLRWAARGDARSMDPHATLEAGTLNINALVYDSLVELDRQDRIVPALATAWSVIEPTRWRFELRRGVRFHDGTPFTAADVVFSIERAQHPKSAVASYAIAVGKAVRIDDHTVEFRQDRPNPILLNQLSILMMMSRDWSVAQRSELPPNIRQKEETVSNRQAMGTGRFTLKQYEPDLRTVLLRNARWWGRFEGNVEQVVFTPIGSDSTRTAALLSGDIDFTQDVPPQDIDLLAADRSVRLQEGPENRIIYFGMDQASDELARSSVKGRNPLKDLRMREAFARAIDAEVIRTSIMRGRSQPTSCMSVSAAGCQVPAALAPLPVDLARARALMAEAGYADGFELALDCPNDRYINDQPMCVAVASMLARIGVRVKVDARSKTQYFQKLDRLEASFYLHGYGYSPDDPQLFLDPVMHSVDKTTRKGGANFGRFADPELDRLIDAAATEMDPTRRAVLIRDAQQRVFERRYYLPIHRQVLTWAARAHVRPVLTSNNIVRVDWIRIDR